jgi:hypothetical protein
MRDGSSLIDQLSWRRFSWLTWKLPMFRQFLFISPTDENQQQNNFRVSENICYYLFVWNLFYILICYIMMFLTLDVRFNLYK